MISSQSVAPYLSSGLLALQHRGQESAGIATLEAAGKIVVLKEMGLVSEALNTDKLMGLQGTIGIGHVRYSTTGSSNIVNAQPFFYESKKALLQWRSTGTS